MSLGLLSASTAWVPVAVVVVVVVVVDATAAAAGVPCVEVSCRGTILLGGGILKKH